MLDMSDGKKLLNLGQHYVASCFDEEVLKNSSSGGMFSAFSKKIFELGGCVFGAAFNKENYKICHVKAENENELKPLRKSKYVWSEWIQCIPDIKNLISEGRYILFTGTPCQCASIRKLFGDYDKLFVVDLFCHGTAEPKYFVEYLKTINANITSIDFRGESIENKVNYNFRIWNNDMVIVDDLYNRNIFLNLYTNSAIIRNNCFSCEYASKRHISDVTIGDYSFPAKGRMAGIKSAHPSIVAVNTDKGKKLLNMCLDVLDIRVLNNKEEINHYYRAHSSIKGQWGYNKEIRNKFLADYNNNGFFKAAISSIYSREIYLIDKLKKIIGKYKGIALYGNGYIGKRLYCLIKQIYPKWNINYFLTSEKQNEELMLNMQMLSINDKRFIEIDRNYFKNVPVYQIDEAPDLKEQIIVISVSESCIEEIEENLKKREIKNYIR